MKLKRLGLLAISVVLLFGTVQAATFSDLSTNHWAYKNINEMYEKGFVSGYTDGTFKPDKAITREEFATILSKFLDLESSWYATEYKDVDTDRWSAEYINAISEYLIDYEIDGEYYFKPSEAVIRKDVAGAIVKVLELDCSYSDVFNLYKQFSDIDELSYNERKGITSAVLNGVMKGNANGTFNPNGVLTRAEITALMCNLSKNQENKINGNETEIITSNLYNESGTGKEYSENVGEDLQIIWLFDGTPRFSAFEAEKILKFAVKGEGNKKVTCDITSQDADNLYYEDYENHFEYEEFEDYKREFTKQYVEYVSEPYKEISVDVNVRTHTVSNKINLLVTVANDKGKTIQKEITIVFDNRFICCTDLDDNGITAYFSPQSKIFKYMIIEGDSLKEDSKIFKYDALEFAGNELQSFRFDLKGISDNTDITILLMSEYETKNSTGESTLARRMRKDVYRLENGKLFFKSTSNPTNNKEYVDFPDSPEYDFLINGKF